MKIQGSFYFTMGIAELLHDLGMETTAVQGSGPSDIQAEFSKISPNFLGNKNSLFHSVCQPWIKLFVPGKIIFQVEVVGQGSLSDLLQAGIIFGFQIAPRDMETVKPLFLCPVHELDQVHFLGSGICMDSPVLAQTP